MANRGSPEANEWPTDFLGALCVAQNDFLNRLRLHFSMLKTTLLHPEILRIAARCGHHANILIADGNYPASTKKGPNAEQVCLQLMPGVPTVAQVLRALLSALPFDAINTMGIPADDPYAQVRRAAGVEGIARRSPPKPAPV